MRLIKTIYRELTDLSLAKMTCVETEKRIVRISGYGEIFRNTIHLPKRNQQE